MKKSILSFAVILLASSSCFAQSYTAVTATVKDSAGAIYAGGSWQANLDISGVPIGQPVTFQRTGSFETAYSGQLDSFGHFSVTLPANDAISPVNTTQWDFRFCQHYASQTQSPAPACFGLTLPITGVSMDITSQVQAASASLGPITPGLVGGSLLPTVTNTYDLGSPTATWANLYATKATLASPLSISSGGTGTASPALAAGTAIGITGAWPNQTINNTSAYASLADPLPVAHGGTGTTTPALTAGTHIALSGSWPDQTVSVTNLQGSDGALLTAGTVSGTGSALCTDSAGGATTSGCSGGGPSATIVGTVDLTSQTSAIGATTILTPSTAGSYRISMWEGKDSSPTWSAGTVTLKASCSWNGLTENLQISALSYSSATGTAFFNDSTPYCDASVPIQYEVDFGSVTGTPVYDIHVRVEQM